MAGQGEGYKYRGRIPIRTGDPFITAHERILQSSRGNTGVHFGADRGAVLHPGLDYMVPNNTPLQMPVEKAVVIGICRVGRDMPARSQGNALVLFVPGEHPYFVYLLHLSNKTFNKSGDIIIDGREVAIGMELARNQLGTLPLAYIGDTASEGKPHLHLSATNRLPYSFRIENKSRQLDAVQFQRMYDEERLNDFLKGKNLNAMKLPGHGTLEKRGYIDPMKLVASGEIRIVRAEMPAVSSGKKTEEPIKLAGNNERTRMRH